MRIQTGLIVVILLVGFASVPMGTTATAEAAQMTISGTIHESDGDPAANHTIYIYEETDLDVGDDEFTAVRTDSNGNFSVSVNSAGEYDVQYYQVSDPNLTTSTFEDATDVYFPNDNSPDIFALGFVTNKSNAEIGQVTLPQAYNVTLTIFAQDGDTGRTRLNNTSVAFSHRSSDNSETFAYFSNGINESVFGPFELTGSVLVGSSHHSNRYYDSVERIDVTSDGNVNLTHSINEYPDPKINASTNVNIGARVVFNASETTDDVPLKYLKYKWDFDNDGVTDTTGKTVNRTFNESGTYNVSLTVVDPGGLSNTTNITIKVTNQTSGSPVQQVAGSDDIIQKPELRTAINKWVMGDFTLDQLRTAIQSWVVQSPVTPL